VLTRKRLIAKTITWRIAATGSMFIFSYLISGSVIVASWISAFEFFFKTFLYMGHEHLWSKTQYGLKKEQE
jgi:uncharacterized membrane protein